LKIDSGFLVVLIDHCAESSAAAYGLVHGGDDGRVVVGWAVLSPTRTAGNAATIPMENVPHTAAALLRLGPNVQALAPTQLVAHLTDTVQTMARLCPTAPALFRLEENGTFVVKRRTSAGLRKKNQRAEDLRRRRELEQRTTGWTDSLDLAGSTTGLVPAVGVPLLRLLAEESGLRVGLSKALRRKDFHPVHDCGQVVTDVAVALAHGARNVANAAGVLDRARVVCGPAASTATVWRVSYGLDETALAALATARAVQRRVGRVGRPPGRFPLVGGRRQGVGRVDRCRRVAGRVAFGQTGCGGDRGCRGGLYLALQCRLRRHRETCAPRSRPSRPTYGGAEEDSRRNWR